MKKIKFILFALFLLLSSGQLWAQKTLPYKPAAMFNGDTLRYLEYNYTKRQAQYAGKTVGEILKEMEYPALYVVEGIYSHSVLVGLSLGIRQVGNKPNPLKDYYITVRFENPPTFDEYKEASGHSGNNPCPVFSQKLYDLIKDLKVSNVAGNLYILKDPELVNAQKRSLDKIYKHAKQTEEMLKRRSENIEN
jgi:hypothetical protein